MNGITGLALPNGRIEKIYLHWSGGDDKETFGSYHFCVARAKSGAAIVVETNDVRANMRDIGKARAEPYAAHTAGRNSYAVGMAIMGMRDARPDDFGDYPLRDDAIGLLCVLIATVAAAYDVPIDRAHVMTHAEAAILDGYFGLDPIAERWDLARLAPTPRPLVPADANVAGDILRARSRAALL